MSRTRALICALTLTASMLGIGLLGAGQAMASHTEKTYFEAGTRLLNEKTRPKVINQLKHLGVNALRVELYWDQVAPSPTAKKRPTGFQAKNPADYNWGPYATLLERAKKLHWSVLLTVTAPAPRWATQSKSAPYVKNPNSKLFGEFMTAVAKEFHSEVSLFAIWNEPNQPSFLQPQFAKNGRPASPKIYRKLFLAGYKGLQKGGIKHPDTLMGETAPTGFAKAHGLHNVAPLVFLRGTLCLSAKYKKAKGCSELPAHGYAHHAYFTAAGPRYKPGAGDVMMGNLGALVTALNKAGHAHAIRSGMKIYLTEFGVNSKPNKYYGVAPSRQAEWDAVSEHIAWQNPRVAAFSQYLLRDDPIGGKPGSIVHGGAVGFQTGLEYVNGKKKPLYRSFPIQLTVSKSKNRYLLWGHVRPTHKRTRVTILVQRKGSKKFRVLEKRTTNSQGYWSASSATAGTHWRVRWEAPKSKGHKRTVYEGPGIGIT